MHNPAQESAMTEIALALAMGFFSIMVLTLISMGIDGRAPEPAQAVQLARAASDDARTGATAAMPDDLIVIYDGQRFLDEAMNPVDPATLPADSPGRRIVLAIDPAVPLAEAMAARSRIVARNTVVSTLDEPWREALAKAKESPK